MYCASRQDCEINVCKAGVAEGVSDVTKEIFVKDMFALQVCARKTVCCQLCLHCSKHRSSPINQGTMCKTNVEPKAPSQVPMWPTSGPNVDEANSARECKYSIGLRKTAS